MKRKISILGLLAVLMLLTISFSSAIGTNTTGADAKESPLYYIRTRSAISSRISEIREKIKSSFFDERAFSLPFQLIRNREDYCLRDYFLVKIRTVNTLTCVAVACSWMICS